jgi:hypothetical protein
LFIFVIPLEFKENSAYELVEIAEYARELNKVLPYAVKSLFVKLLSAACVEEYILIVASPVFASVFE